MEQYIFKSELKDYLILPNTFDWDLVDQEVGFGKIFDVFSKEIYLNLTTSQQPEEKEIAKLLTKAGVYYSFIFSIPKLKVHISNYGIQDFNQEKVKSAPWWDIRDLGLSMLKIADRSLSDALRLAKNIGLELPFFEKENPIIGTPSDFEDIYSIGHSVDVYKNLSKYFDTALYIHIYEKIGAECIESILQNDFMKPLFKKAFAFYTLYQASLLPSFTFTQNAVVVQYEELPWQKSVVLDNHTKILAGQNFKALADENIKAILNYMKANAQDFPCFKQPEADRKIEVRQSGIYL